MPEPISDAEIAAAIGRTHEIDDVIALDRARALWASLDAGDQEPRAGDPLPPLWHWLYFWELTPRSSLAFDGHGELGEFLPPLGDVRRMWAGSRVTFHQPLRIGQSARRVTTLTSITPKTGRSGPLIFVKLTHEITTDDGLAITDEQDLVYRGPAGQSEAAKAPQSAPKTSTRTEMWTGDPVLLFRYSALTFNAHRIHYDVPYATGEDGYQSLIVHGPLIATLMAGAASRHRGGAALANFTFRAVSPIFADDSFFVHLDESDDKASLWVRNADGAYAATGSADWVD